MSSTDIRRLKGNVNAQLIANLPIASTASTNEQTLVYNSTTGYWTPSSVMTVDSDQTISGVFTFAGLTRIGANGSTLGRVNTFVGPNFSTAFGTNADGNIPVQPAFASQPTLMLTLVDPTTAVQSFSTMAKFNFDNALNPGLNYGVRNLRTGTPSTTNHENALSII